MRSKPAAVTVALISLALGCIAFDLLSPLLFLMPGCSMPRGSIVGTVRYDGKLVPVGTITFNPEKGRTVLVEIEGGRYTVKKVPPGPYIVTVNTGLYRRTWHILKKQRELSGGRLPPDLEGTAEKWQTVRSRIRWGIEGLPVFVASTAASTAGLLGIPCGQGPRLAASALLPGRTGTEEEWDKVKDMVAVPKKFADPETSGLVYTIMSGKQEIDIDIPKE